MEAVETLAEALESKGFEPVLVGGMALVILGSQRITEDYDFLVTTRGPRIRELVGIMYRHGLELITKLNPEGEVIRTVDNPRVAAAKVEAESPKSLFFIKPSSELRVDILLDFPMPAHEVS